MLVTAAAHQARHIHPEEQTLLGLVLWYVAAWRLAALHHARHLDHALRLLGHKVLLPLRLPVGRHPAPVDQHGVLPASAQVWAAGTQGGWPAAAA